MGETSTYSPRRRGDLGEASAIEWFTAAGARVCLPLFNDPDYDLIADWGDRLERVQVKTSVCLIDNRYQVALRTSGGNQSWSRIIKYMDASRCDVVFVHVGDGRRWRIPTAALQARSAISLGGSKYAEFEVDPGRPLPLIERPDVAPVALD